MVISRISLFIFFNSSLYPLYYRLMELLKEISLELETKTIIFVETKRKVDEIEKAICRRGYDLFFKYFSLSMFQEKRHLH